MGQIETYFEKSVYDRIGFASIQEAARDWYENVYGKAIETEKIKLKRYDELLTAPGSPEELPLKDTPVKGKRFFLFVAITGGLMFLLLLLFVILWFNNYL